MRNFFYTAWENLIYILVGILFLNVLILNYFTFFGKPRQIVQNITVGGTTTAGTNNTAQNGTQTTPFQQLGTTDVCPNTCLAAIKTATSSLKLTQNVTNTTTQQISSGSNEYFVPFGAATGASQGSFSTLSALQAYMNISNYSNVASVVLEVSITSNGIASVQLYDATDGNVIPNSQVTTQGGSPQLLISGPLSLPAGNKLYQIQIQTQLNSPATIDQARLHITLQ
ncbi:MAG: hypothetical protein KBC00_01285 [Candidatus Levybacteria bacterium]|nr:hypothetical protein [Candidatus Levybacteria bacterium]MBP9814969.1 hypothetical protein [Candidatus Levybacteria bacterium]